jgi:type II secretory pathway pseudopilin PulG
MSIAENPAGPKTSAKARAILILGIFAAICVVAVLAFGFLMMRGDRRAASQAAAVGSLRTLNAALDAYSSTYGHGFPRDLGALRPPAAGGRQSADAAGLVDDRLASGQRRYYKFTYAPTHFDRNGFPDAYSLHADPEGQGSGASHFYTDQTGIIRSDAERPAEETSPPLPE